MTLYEFFRSVGKLSVRLTDWEGHDASFTAEAKTDEVHLIKFYKNKASGIRFAEISDIHDLAMWITEDKPCTVHFYKNDDWHDITAPGFQEYLFSLAAASVPAVTIFTEELQSYSGDSYQDDLEKKVRSNIRDWMRSTNLTAWPTHCGDPYEAKTEWRRAAAETKLVCKHCKSALTETELQKYIPNPTKER